MPVESFWVWAEMFSLHYWLSLMILCKAPFTCAIIHDANDDKALWSSQSNYFLLVCMYPFTKYSSQTERNWYGRHFGDDPLSLEETKQVTQVIQLSSTFRGGCLLLSDEETQVSLWCLQVKSRPNLFLLLHSCAPQGSIVFSWTVEHGTFNERKVYEMKSRLMRYLGCFSVNNFFQNSHLLPLKLLKP